MKRKILVFLGAVMITAGVMNLGISRGVYAENCGDTKFVGLSPWYDGLECETLTAGGKKTISPSNFNDIPTVIVKVAANVMQDLMFVVGVLAVGFIVYAGFLMITAQGDVGAVAKAKKTLTRALTGVVIAALASTIIGVIKYIFWR